MSIAWPRSSKVFHSLRHGRRCPGAERRRRRTGRAFLRLEQLEDRTVPSVVPVGPEIAVGPFTAPDTYQAAGQPGQTSNTNLSRPATALDAHGNFVIAWTSIGPDGDGAGVFAERFSAAGVPLGPAFQVNTSTAGDQAAPAVAMDGAGDFLITWQSKGQDGDGWGVFAQLYHPDGMPNGTEFPVNTITAGDQFTPAAAMDAHGNFVITWTSDGQDGDGLGVFARQFDNTGTPLQAAEFQVNTYTAGDQARPAVAADPAGDFVITWESYGQDGDGWGVFAQQFDPTGTPLHATDIPVNTTTTNDQRLPAVAMDGAGNFLVSWESYGQDGDSWGIYVQQFDPTGTAFYAGFDVPINTYTRDAQKRPAVAVDGAGNFVVTWISNNEISSGFDVYAQVISEAGFYVGGETLVNSTTAGDQFAPAVAMDRGGDFVIAWPSYHAGDTADAGPGTIAAQRFGQVTAIGSTFADAQPLPLVSGYRTQSGTIAAPGAAQVFSFVAPFTGGLTIRADPLFGSLDPALAVYDASGGLVKSNDDISQVYGAVKASSLVRLNLAQGQTYYVRASASPAATGSAATGDYTLTFGPDDVGNHFADAAPITVAPSGTTVTGSVEVSGDADTYQFTAPFTGGLRVDLAATGDLNLHPSLAAFDGSPQHQPLDQSPFQGATTVTSLSFLVVQGQTYFIQAAGADTSTGPYQVTFTRLSDATGHTFDTAVPVDPSGAGGPVDGTLAYPGQVDLYAFTAAQTGQVTVTQKATGSSHLDSQVNVFDANRRILTFNDDNGADINSVDSRITFPVEVGQTYYVQAAASVNPVPGHATGDYELTFATLGTTAPPGHTFDQPGTVTLTDSAARAFGAIRSAGQLDVYRFTADRTGPLIIREAADLDPSDQLLTQLFLFTGSRQLIAFSLDSTSPTFGPGRAFFEYHNSAPDQFFYDYHDGATSLIHQAQSPGNTNYSLVKLDAVAGQTYYIGVTAFRTSEGAYNLTFTPGDVPNTFGDAAPLPLDATGAGSVAGALAVPEDTDLFRLVAPTTSQMTVEMDPAPGSALNASLLVYDARHNYVQGTYAAANGRSFFQFKALAGHAYYVQAAAADESVGGFLLSVAPVVPDGYSNDLTHPTDITARFGADGSASLTGDILTVDTVEAFQFTAPASGEMTIHLDATADSPLDGSLYVFDGAGNFLTFNDNGGDGLNSLVHFQVTAGQTYVLETYGSGYTFGRYTLSFATAAPVPDDVANTFADAAPVTLAPSGPDNVLGSVAGTVNYAGDVDVFQFTAPLTGLVAVEQEAAAGSSLDSTLQVFASVPTIYDSLSPLAYDDDITPGSNLNSRVEVSVTAGHTYYVLASASPYAAAGQQTGAYLLTFADIDDHYGGDFPHATALAVSASGPTILSGSVEAPNQDDQYNPLTGPGVQDYFSFVAPLTGQVSVEMDAAGNSSLNSYVQIYDSAHTLVTTDDDSAGNLNALAQFSVVQGQTYYIEAGASPYGYGATLTGDYSLTVTPMSAGGPSAGDPFANPLPLTLDTTTPAVATGVIDQPGDVTVYQFTAPAGTVNPLIRVAQDANPAGPADDYLDSFVSVFDSSHHLVASDDDGGGSLNSLAEFTAVAGQTYYVEAGAYGDSTGAYRLTVGALVHDSFGPSFANATNLNASAPTFPDGAHEALVPMDAHGFAGVNGTLFADGTDFFRFTAPVTGGLTVEEDWNPPTGTDASSATAPLAPYLFVFDSAQHLLSSSDGTGDPQQTRVQINVVAGRTYFIEAAGTDHTAGDFHLTVAPVPDDYGSTFATAHKVTVSAAQPVGLAGTISVAGNDDMFRIVPRASGTLTVEADAAAGSGLDPVLSAFGNTRQRIAYNDDIAPGSNLNSQITFNVVAGQTYYVMAAGYGLSTGDYGLQISLNPFGHVIENTGSAGAVDTSFPRTVQVTAGDLRQSFTQDIRTSTDPTQTAQDITTSIVQTFLNAQTTPLTSDTLVFWFDPVDFIVTDPQGRQTGYTQAQGQVNNIPGAQVVRAGTGALQLLIIPDALAAGGEYHLELLGVGANQVLAGGALVSAGGVMTGATARGDAGLAASSTGLVTFAGTVLKDGLVAVLDFQSGVGVPPLPGPRGPTPAPLPTLLTAAAGEAAAEPFAVFAALTGTGLTTLGESPEVVAAGRGAALSGSMDVSLTSLAATVASVGATLNQTLAEFAGNAGEKLLALLEAARLAVQGPTSAGALLGEWGLKDFASFDLPWPTLGRDVGSILAGTGRSVVEALVERYLLQFRKGPAALPDVPAAEAVQDGVPLEVEKEVSAEEQTALAIGREDGPGAVELAAPLAAALLACDFWHRPWDEPVPEDEARRSRLPTLKKPGAKRD